MTNSQFCSALGKELEMSNPPQGITTEEQTNLSLSFELIQPTCITDLAFVAWCGTRCEPALEYAIRYRAHRATDISHSDCYPYVSLNHRILPDSGGVFAFSEEIVGLVSELTGSRSNDAMAMVWQIYRAGHTGITRKKIGPKKLLAQLKPEYQERYKMDDISQLHRFIANCYGISRPYSMFVILVERALKRLAADHKH